MTLVKKEWTNFENQVQDTEEFLRQPAVLQTMFQSDSTLFQKELMYIKENNNDYLKLFKDPNQYGSPMLFNINGEVYNPNDIHHLYHLCRYENAMGKIKSPTKILEWGGGYGNMCKVMNMVYGNLIESYTIIDLPKFTKISELYISTVCETMNHNHFSIDDFKDKIESKYDMFLSTWALSESPTSCSSFLDENNFYGCSKFLVSLHQCGNHIPFMLESTNLRNVLHKYETKEENIGVIGGINYYIFK